MMCSGRTDAMLQKALWSAAAGSYVIVVADNDKHRRTLYRRLVELLPESSHWVPTNDHYCKVVYREVSIHILSRSNPDVDMRVGRLLSGGPSVVVYADHLAAANYVREVAGWALSQFDIDELKE
jgi:hypothetical protein